MKFKRYCKTCGKLIPKEKNRSWNEYKKKKYCSRKCCSLAHSKTTSVSCDYCGKKIYRPPSHIYKHNFCSRECKKKFFSSLKERTCIFCGSKFIVNSSTSNQKYCSFECFKNSRWEVVKCAYCGTEFKKRIGEIKRSEQNKSVHICSIDCRNRYTSLLLGGDGTWNKSKNPKPTQKKYGNDWQKQRRLVLELYEYMCYQCGSTKNLQVHHWEPYSISCNNSLDNLVVLCADCHNEIHDFYRREGFYEDIQREGFWD